MRIGINTGPVVVAQVRGGEAASVTAIGDTVNLASRLLTVLSLASAHNLGLLLNLLGLKVPDDALSGLDGTLIGLRTRDLLLQILKALGVAFEYEVLE